MADSDFNVIKPVESLQTIQGLAPTTRQQERRRRRQGANEHRDDAEEKRREDPKPLAPDDGDDPHSIDYRA